MATKDDKITQEHRKSFQLFTRLLGYSSAVIALVLILMALFIL